MRFIVTTLTYLIFFFSLSYIGAAQQHTLNLTIENQPETQIVLSWIKGDDFIKIDSAKANNGQVTFNIYNTAHSGIYRITLGKTTYARVMDEAPQQFDFVFNNEDIVIETDFKHPIEKLIIVSSEENKLWHGFLAKEKEYNEKLTTLEKELNNYWKRNDTTMALSFANDFNRLQMEWDLRLSQTVQQNSNLFASKIIAISRKPILDGFLSQEEREKQLKTEFFKNTNFSSDELIYSSAYTDKIFEYLILFNHASYTQEKRTEEYTKAVDVIMKNTGQNEKVSEFITSYLIHGFDVLNMDELIKHIRDNY